MANAVLRWQFANDPTNVANYADITPNTLRYRNANNNTQDTSDPLVKPDTGVFASYEKWTRINVNTSPGVGGSLSNPRLGLSIAFEGDVGTNPAEYTGIYFYFKFTQTGTTPTGDSNWDQGTNKKTGFKNTNNSAETWNDAGANGDLSTNYILYRDGSGAKPDFGSQLGDFTGDNTGAWKASGTSGADVHLVTVIELGTTATGGAKTDFQLVFRFDEV